MVKKKILGGVAFALALTGGGVAGAMLGMPSGSGAATNPSTTAPATTSPSATPPKDDHDHGPGERGPGFGGGAGLPAAAKALGITEEDLRGRLQDGKTIAAVAKDEGVAVQKVIDAMVAADAKAIDEAATRAKAGLEDRVTDQVNNAFPKGGPGHDGHGRGPGGPGAGPFAELSVAAKALGVTEDQLRTQLQDGKTLADVAKAQEIDPQEVIDALVADATTKIDARVTAGDLTKDEATEIKADLADRIAEMVNEGGRGGFGHGPGRPGR